MTAFARPFQIHIPETPRCWAQILHGVEFPRHLPFAGRGPVVVWDPDTGEISRHYSVAAALDSYDDATVIWPEEAAS